MADTPKERRLPAPKPNAETQRFWDAAVNGHFLIKRCRTCGEPHFYPRALCPFCFSDQTEWQQASGRGTLYSFSVMRRGPGSPYAVAYVTLDEGPSVLTNLVDCDLDGLTIGQRMTVRFVPSDDDGLPIPMFTTLGGRND